MIRGIKASIITAALLWTGIMATNDTSTQAPAIMPERGGALQKQVMSVNEMCELLGTARLLRENAEAFSRRTIIRTIRISMNDLCAKEKNFENKAVPATEELMNGHMVKIIYMLIRIKDTTIQEIDTEIKSKHIRALGKFLQMFAGCNVNFLFIHNKKITQNKGELQNIKKILDTTRWVGLPIYVENMMFISTAEAEATHPVLLQIMLHAMNAVETSGEIVKHIWIYINVDYTEQIFQLLSKLRCKKIEYLSLDIKGKKQAIAGEPPVDKIAPKEHDWIQKSQEWAYEVERLRVVSYYDSNDAIFPSWLIGKPTQLLNLNMQLYMRLSKDEVMSIRAPVLWVIIDDAIDRLGIERDAEQKKSQENTNEKITKLRIDHRKYSSQILLTKEQALMHVRCCLVWAAIQFPSLTAIDIDGINQICSDKPGHVQAISRMTAEFSPIMQNLKIIMLDKQKVHVLGSEYLLLRTMPFVIRSRLWKVFVSGQMETQINKQKDLVKGQEGYIRMHVSESVKNTEHFVCPICMEEVNENDDSSWIYVTWPCRHAFCLECLNTCFKNGNPKCHLDQTPLLWNWKECWRIEEADNNEYSITPSRIEEDSDGKVQVKDFSAGKTHLVVEY